MNSPTPRAAAFTLLLALALQGCVVPKRTLERLSPGMWVEVRGTEFGRNPAIQKIEQVERSPSDTPDKVEITAPVREGLEGKSFKVLGGKVRLVEKTTFEDLNRKEVPQFDLDPGKWLKIRARIKKDQDRLQARSIREISERDRFKVAGEITSLDVKNNLVHVGTLPFVFQSRSQITLLEAQRKNPLRLFIEDDKKGVPFTIHLTDNLLLGGGIEVKFEMDQDLDLDSGRQRDREKLNTGVKLDLLWAFDDEGSFVLFEPSATRRARFNENSPDETDYDMEISRAYAYYKISDMFQLEFGRQDFDDYREWLYDERLDGVRLHTRTERLHLELSASAGREVAAPDNDTEDTYLFAGVCEYEVRDRHYLSGYVLKRKDGTQTDFEPLLFGTRSYQRPRKGLGHWAELSFASGIDGLKDIDGRAFDVGLMYRLNQPWHLTLFGGYAFARGRRDGTNREGYRQSGLQDNNGKFGGVTSYKYYGEVFEPELANMAIVTAGIGFRPSRQVSLDIVVHSYKQDLKSTTLADDGLRGSASPNGSFAELGRELDLILGYRQAGWLHTELVLGGFFPGKAFDDQDNAYKLELLVRFKF